MQQIYECKKCDYICYKKSNLNIHLNTNKHKKNEGKEIVIVNNENKCLCGKIYNHSSSLWKHKQKCITNGYINNIVSNNATNNNTINNNATNNNEKFFKELVHNNISLITATQEFKTMIVEQQKQIQEQQKLMFEMANKAATSNTNNNTINNVSNQQFNLNMFLNETCKDAMNLSEFIENIHVSMEDMEKTGELGFAKGMSRIIMNNLNAIDVCKRPIHCSDVKRETLYVKNNGVWEKETDERNKTKEIIYRVSRLNLKHLLKWRDLPRNKGYEKSDHVKNDEFTNLVMEINKMREEEFDKIITSISKHVAIDKERAKMSGYLN